MHLPAAYAEYARAEAHRYRATGDQTALTNALGAADWLESNTDLDGDGELGWGLPYAWDASGDGVVNPPNTEYLIDTAFAIEALLEVREAALAAGETERAAAFLNAALGAATTFASGKFERDATGIVFWYSSLPHDNFPNVNSSAAFVGQLQRLSRFPSPRAQQFAQLADEGAAYLLARRETQQGVPFWRYNGWDVPTWPQNKPNDLSHEVATFDGLLTYKDYGGAHGSAVDPESFLDSLSRFVQPDRPHEFPLGFPYPAEVQADMEARWPKISAVGYALYFAARQERLINRPAVHTQALREALFRDYRTGDHWRYRPEDAQIVDGVPSQMAGVLLGLSYDEF